ncbi:hypothetical protein SNEBB_003036 [Seison nebaliae]|nr:hypothetical protein SNEBB_003036 [Seison nebaliae]
MKLSLIILIVCLTCTFSKIIEDDYSVNSAIDPAVATFPESHAESGVKGRGWRRTFRRIRFRQLLPVLLGRYVTIISICGKFTDTKNCEEPWLYPHDETTMQIIELNYGKNTNMDPGLPEGGYVLFECQDKTKKLEEDKVYCVNGKLEEKSLVCK